MTTTEQILKTAKTTPLDWLRVVRDRWAEHGWEGVEESEAYGSMLRTYRLLTLHVDKLLGEIGLTGPRHTLLFTLDCAPKRSLNVGQLSRRMMQHPTSITKLVDPLEAAGLVRKKVPDHDRRSIVVELTKKGERTLEKAAKLLGGSRFGLSVLDTDQVHALTQLLETVRLHVLENGAR